jgi:hypothetical protein
MRSQRNQGLFIKVLILLVYYFLNHIVSFHLFFIWFEYFKLYFTEALHISTTYLKNENPVSGPGLQTLKSGFSFPYTKQDSGLCVTQAFCPPLEKGICSLNLSTILRLHILRYLFCST